jgi:hypothetical protein
MQIKTIKDGTASLRKVTVGHAVRILVSEVLQAQGEFFYSWPRGDRRPLSETMMPYILDNAEGIVFNTDDASYEFRGNKQEIERFSRVADLALKAGRTRAGKFDSFSQRIWMCAVLNGYEADSFHLARDHRDRSLYILANVIDEIINRHGITTLAA